MSKVSLFLGSLLLLLGVSVTFKLFYPPLKEEFKYQLKAANLVPKPTLSPPNTDFSILIPKLGATAEIIQDVSPTDSREYQLALTRGVAHAKGTMLPGSGKNIFLFAHSSTDLLVASQYNSVFYLLHHLESGDEIIVWYQGSPHRYQLTKKEIVPPAAVSYLSQKTDRELLTLMTCWPPGTTLNRLILTAEHLP